MSLIHLHNEIASHRELAAESWSVYLSYSIEESTGMIHADTIQVYYNTRWPSKSWRRRIGQQRISYNKAPFCLGKELRMLEDIIPAQLRDTVSAKSLRMPELTSNVETQALASTLA